MKGLFSVCLAPSRHTAARQRTFWFPVFFLCLNRLWLGARCLLSGEGTEYPVGLGTSVLAGTRMTWGREDGLVRAGGNVCLQEVWPIAPMGTLNSGGCGSVGTSTPRGCWGKELPREEGRWGDSIPSGLRKLSGSQKCARLVGNPATSCWNTLLKRGRGEPQWLTVVLLPRARIELLFMASSVCPSGSQPRQETIWLRVLESFSPGIYR